MSRPAMGIASDTDASFTGMAGRLMVTHPRQSWLVPLLAVPLSQVALSPSCPDEVLSRCSPDRDVPGMRVEAAGIATFSRAVVDSNGTRGLTDEEAWLLLRYTYDYVGLGQVGLLPPAFLMVGMGLHPGLPAGPLLHLVAEWVGSEAMPVPMATFITTRALSMTRRPPMFLPKIDGYYGELTRAIDRRLQEQGVETWEDALALAYHFWSAGGWRDLCAWQADAFHQLETKDIYKTEREEEVEEHEKQRRRHRAERRRLQDEAAAAHGELRRLRPLQAKVAGLRAETERLRNREAELTQARDRALARARALEAANGELERDCREARHRLADLMPAPAEPAEPAARAALPVMAAEELPHNLLTGRTVFFFTGELRRSTAEATAESLRVLGAEEIRTFCLRQGSEGPETYPSDAIVIVDFRFAGHSQSGLIQDRAVRSGARFLSVRSGKGGLARTVAGLLLNQSH